MKCKQWFKQMRWVISLLILGMMCYAQAEKPKQQSTDLMDHVAAVDQALQEKLGSGETEAAIEYEWLFEDALKLRDTTLRRIPQGIEPVDLKLSVFRMGDRWSQSNWSVASQRLASRMDVREINLSGLQVTDSKLSGKINMLAGRRSTDYEMGRGENAHSMMKAARRSVLGWNIGGIKRVNPFNQGFDIKVKAIPDAYLVRLTLSGAIGTLRESKAPKANENQPVSWEELGQMRGLQRKDVSVDMIYRENEWEVLDVLASQFNQGDHRIDASQLKISADRIEGTLIIHYGSDRWVKGGTVSYELNLSSAMGHLNGEYKASGVFGEYVDRTQGSQWHLMEGQYHTDSLDGQWSGKMIGGWRQAPRQVQALIQDEINEEMHLTEKLAALNARLMVLKYFPLSVDQSSVINAEFESLAQQENKQHQSIVQQYVSANRTRIESNGTFIYGNHQSEDPSFGPYGHASRQTESASHWKLIRDWSVMGPLVGRGTGLNSQRVLPAVFPDLNSTYQDYRLILNQQKPFKLQWQKQVSTDGRIMPHPSDWADIWVNSGKMSSYKKHPLQKAYRAREAGSRHYDWYGVHFFDQDEKGKVWLALQAVDFGQLWVNGELVWESGEKYDSSQPVVIQVSVKAGKNHLLMRSGKNRVTYFPPKADARSWFRVWLNESTEPRDETQRLRFIESRDALYTQRNHQIGEWDVYSRRSLKANPPAAWKAKGAVNVLWRKKYEGVRTLQPWGDQILLMTDNQLISVKPEDGKVNWEFSPEQVGGGRSQLSVHGDRAYVYFAGGQLVALNPEGKPEWQVSLPGGGLMGNYSGPLFLEQKIYLLQSASAVSGNKKSKAAKGQASSYVLRAIEATTGKQVWVTQAYTGKTVALVKMSIPVMDQLMNVLMTGDGRVFDPVKGTLLAEGLFNTGPELNGHELPLVEEDKVYLTTRRGQMALRLWMNDQGQLSAIKLWEFLRSGHGGAAGVIVQNRLYVPRIADEYHAHHTVCWEQLDVYDLKGGHHLAKRKPVVLDALSPGPMIASKDYLIYSSTGRAGGGHYPGVQKPRAQLVMLTQGETPLVLSRMSFAYPMTAFPVLDGERLLVGIGKEIWCMGLKGDKGKQLESMVKARSVLKEVGKRLIPRKPMDIKGIPSDQATILSDPELVRDGIPPINWMVAGAMDRASLAPYSAEIVKNAGAILSASPLAKSFQPLDPAMLFKNGSRQIFEGTRRIFVDMQAVNLSMMFKGKRNSAAVYYTELLIPETTTYKVTTKKSSMASFYLGGQKVDPGTVVTLEPGRYSLVMELKVSRLPPVGKVSMAVALVETSDPQLEMDAYLARVKLYQDALKSIAVELPETAEALLAENHLKMIAK